MPNRNREPRRRVDSSSWPLYVCLLVSMLVASLIQIVQWKPPPSVATQSPPWFDPWYLSATPVGSACVLIALFGVRTLVPSLQLERIGCIINATIGAAYFVAVALNNDGPPSTSATWLTFGFSAYSAYRIHEINKAFGLDVLKPFRRKEARS